MSEQVIAGRCALVTGAGRGIGYAIASALVDEGMKVAVVDIDEASAQRASESLQQRSRGTGKAVVHFGLDVRDAARFADVVASVEQELAPIDVLVNNAGIMCLGTFLDQDPASDDRQIDINLRGVIHGLRAALPGMIARRRGHVVNIASVVGKVAAPHAAVYSATKHAVVGLTEALRHEYEDTGLLFSYILPSFVDTELIAGTGRLRYPPPVRPDDVALAVVDALRRGRVDVYVPRFGRLGSVLPALLPRSTVERIGRWFGVDRVFKDVDTARRAAYADRVSGERQERD